MIETVEHWQDQLQHLHQRIAPRFRRAEPRRRALGYLRGLLSCCERKNGWQLAERLGEATPDGVQRLLNAADWDADAVRDDLRNYVVEHLGHEEAVLIVDETGFLKKGTRSVGVKRQYSGTAGRIENCQIGVFLCYASLHGVAFLDRALYLPEDWSNDKARRQAAGVPEAVAFATKPRLAEAMLERAFAAAVPCAWVTGDTVYGGDRRLRLFLEAQEQPFVLAVPSNELLWYGGPTYYRASELAARVEPEAWQRRSAGAGSKGPRLYDWTLVELWRLQRTPQEQAWGHYLLVRRSISDPEALAYYVVFARRQQAMLERLVRVAGSRWQIEQAFEAAKGECGLDEYEVRKWGAWHRHMTLSLLAYAFLVVMRAQGQKKRE
ncbi:MAG: transposase [Rhodothermaceae bacterium]|nr:MAG: transposase [Rhodothermaceae bacterium]GIV62257.1 MAG: transposase [Rhodothermaceae bacterium]